MHQPCDETRQPPPTATQLETVFNHEFARSMQTVLVGGQVEPFYQAKKPDNTHHIIYYTHDYVSSALHEVSHWCVAGDVRRAQDDYGYWYSPDGRTQDQQNAFEKVEVKPQALEWIFSMACGITFRVSADNLTLDCGPSRAFKEAILNQVYTYLHGALNARSLQFLHVLEHKFHNEHAISASLFSLSDLR